MIPKNENALQRQILDALDALPGAEFIRVNSGKVKVRGAWMHLAPVGTSDILGIVRGGRFVALEVKLPKESPTPEQIAFGERIAKLGGFFAVVHSVDEAVNAVREAEAA